MLSPVSELWTGRLAELKRSEADSPHLLGSVASEFESLLVGEMLKVLRESSPEGWLGGGEDQAGAILVEVAEQQFAQALCSQGGLGLAATVVRALEKPATFPVQKPAALPMSTGG